MICGKCETEQDLKKISCGPKEEDWCYWCKNCKDRISPSACYNGKVKA